MRENKAGFIGNLFKMDTDLKAIISLAAIALISMYLPFINTSLIRVTLGLIFIVFLSGYALVSALFPARSVITDVERIALSISMSIVVVPIIGIILNFTKMGIRPGPMNISITLIIILLCIIANERRKRLSDDERYSTNISWIFLEAKNMLKNILDDPIKNISLLLPCAAILFSIVLIGIVLSIPQQVDNYTIFYIDDINHTDKDFPINFNLSEEKPIIAGIINRENSNRAYELIISIKNETLSNVIYSNNISLEKGDKWEETIYLKPDIAGKNLKIEFMLYDKNDKTVPYRSLHLWINVNPAPVAEP